MYAFSAFIFTTERGRQSVDYIDVKQNKVHNSLIMSIVRYDHRKFHPVYTPDFWKVKRMRNRLKYVRLSPDPIINGTQREVYWPALLYKHHGECQREIPHTMPHRKARVAFKFQQLRIFSVRYKEELPPASCDFALLMGNGGKHGRATPNGRTVVAVAKQGIRQPGRVKPHNYENEALYRRQFNDNEEWQCGLRKCRAGGNALSARGQGSPGG